MNKEKELFKFIERQHDLNQKLLSELLVVFEKHKTQELKEVKQLTEKFRGLK